MIFRRKYIFETKRTRFIRYGLNLGALLFFIAGSYISFLLYIPFYSHLERKITQSQFYQKSPEAIVVFTGDKGRIKYSLEALKKWPEAELLISGVYEKNTFKTLVSDREDAKALLEAPLKVGIDYEAKNTLENVKETLEHLEKISNQSTHVLIISSDYHIFRINYLFKQINKNKNIKIFYHGVESDWTDLKMIKKLIFESFKYLRIRFLLET